MKIGLYMHNGSGNHGCEAIIRSTIHILEKNIVLYSANPKQDQRWKLDKICKVERQGKDINFGSMKHIALKGISIMTRSNSLYYKTLYSNLLQNKNEISCFLSIGGDTYCYTSMPDQLRFINQRLSTNAKLVLWGCSIEPELCKQRQIVQDLKKYDLITARESLTYEALQEAGLAKNVCLVSDPAFTLEAAQTELPEIFKKGKVVGINISPMVLKYGDRKMIIDNFKCLIRYLLQKTDYQIAFIPHVNCSNNSDIVIMREIEKEINSSRIELVKEHNCLEIKYIIANCELFIGTRTHAIIAAYSSCVPTLTVGYSIKARGIAKDLFGDENESYVVSVQDICEENMLIREFEKLYCNKENLRLALQNSMPAYIAKAYLGKTRLMQILNKET